FAVSSSVADASLATPKAPSEGAGTAKGQSADKQTLREKSADEAPAGQVDATTRGTAGDPSAEAENVSPIYAADPDGESEAPRADIEPGVHGLSPSALARLLGADLREMNGTADGVGSDSAETTPASDAPVTVDDPLSQMAEEGELAIPDPKDLPEPADSAVQAATTPRLTAAEERDRLQRVTVGSGGLPPLLPPEPRTELTAAEVERGRAAFDVAIAEAPRDGELRARYARFLAVALGDYGSAQEQFEEAELLLPKNVDILCDYATFALKALADGDLAEKLLSQAFHLDERSPTVLRALADFLLRARGEVDEAENCLRLAVDINPKDSESRIAYARFLLDRRGRREVAEGLFRKAAEIDDKNGAVLAELALFQAETAQTVDRAAQQIDRAAELSPHHPMVLFAQAVIAERKGELDEAESSLLRAVKADPQHQRAQLALAKFLTSRRRDLERAKGQFEDALKALPLEAEVYTAYAIFCERQLDDTDTAEGLHRDAIRLEPNNPLVLAAFAEFLGRHSEFVDEAERLFSDALAQAPRSPAILRAFGTFLAERGDADKAEKYLRRAVEFDPNGAEAFDDLATFLANIRKDADEAEIYFREALRLAPDRTETLTKFAAFLRESKGDLDEAEAQFRKAVQRNPKDAATLSRTAQFLLAQGHRAEGLKILNEAFDAAYSLDLEVRPSWLMLELWICRFAHDPARQAESARAAKGLLASGVRSEGWDYRLVVETAIEVGHSDAQQLRSLALVAVDDAEEDLLSA
ncbi:MAG: tetratricopeptide repeat protein, partial [Pseudomonadota bacterium]